MWTKLDIQVTKTHIETVKLSNIKPQEASNNSESIQGLNFIYTGHLDKPTSKKEIQDITKEDNRNEHVTKAAPFGDINLPRDIDIMNPISGKKINNKYIIILLIN